MLGRTLLQPALPITFGLKVAGWSAGLERGWSRLADACRDGLMLQFGGAAGTLAALGEQGSAVARALASSLELGLSGRAVAYTSRSPRGDPCGMWHLHRHLGKIATDISLLMQHEVGEVQEPGGGRRPCRTSAIRPGCAIVIAAATRTPGLVATFLTGMVQEHERRWAGGMPSGRCDCDRRIDWLCGGHNGGHHRRTDRSSGRDATKPREDPWDGVRRTREAAADSPART